MLTLTGDDVLLRDVAVIALLGAWAFFFAAYLVFAGQASVDEIVAAAVCATAAMLWLAGTRRASAHTFAFASGSWAAAGRACRRLPWATVSVVAALLRLAVRHRGGEVKREFFAHGRRTDPVDAGRRAVGVLAASLAPDSFVLRTAVDRDEIVVHALIPGKPSRDPRWPI